MPEDVRRTTADASTLERRQLDAPHLEGSTFVLDIAGGDVTDGGDAPASVVIDATSKPRAFIGRSDLAQLRLRDPLVSRRHAALELTAGGLRVTDMGSKDGTFVNGVRVNDAVLVGGEKLRVGNTLIEVRRDPAPSELRITDASRFGRLLGKSTEMRRLHALCERIALADAPVIISGETGTGKELLAEVLHEVGPRASGPFVVRDSAPAALGSLEAAFREAHDGTLLLDEVGDLDADSQARLLQLLRDGKHDTRLIVTTTRDLERAIEEGRFREDLYYRLGVLEIELPPLRRRIGDIELLAEHFWTTFGGAGSPPADFLQIANGSNWPGNVRELANAVARRLVTGAQSDGKAKDAGDDKPLSSTAPGEYPRSPSDIIEMVIAQDLAFPAARRRVLDTFELRYTEWILAKHNGNVSRAAAASGIARRYFYTVRARAKG